MEEKVVDETLNEEVEFAEVNFVYSFYLVIKNNQQHQFKTFKDMLKYLEKLKMEEQEQIILVRVPVDEDTYKNITFE